MSKLEFKEVEKVLAEDGNETLEEGNETLGADPTPFLQPFEITPEVREFITKYNLAEDIEEVGDDGKTLGKLTEEKARELADSKQLFLSHKEADRRLEEASSLLKSKVQEMCQAQSLECEVEVTPIEQDFGNSYALNVELKKGDEESSVDVFHYTFEPWQQIAEGADSWTWAAWLGIEDSPFFSEEVCNAYDYDQMSIAQEQFVHTLDESQDKGDLENLVKEFKSGHDSKFTYHFHEERGAARGYVENAAGETVWQSSNEDSEDGSFPPVEDGFMRHSEDIQGLERYLKQLGIMPANATLTKGS